MAERMMEVSLAALYLLQQFPCSNIPAALKYVPDTIMHAGYREVPG